MSGRRLDHQLLSHAGSGAAGVQLSYGGIAELDDDAGQDEDDGESVPLQKQPSTDQQTDSELSQPTTVTSHLSLPHFAFHRQVRSRPFSFFFGFE